MIVTLIITHLVAFIGGVLLKDTLLSRVKNIANKVVGNEQKSSEGTVSK